MNIEEAKNLLYRARAEPLGLLVQCSDFNRARGLLYKARAEAQDPGLANLQLRSSPVEGGNLIILNQTVQLGAPPSPPILSEL